MADQESKIKSNYHYYAVCFVVMQIIEASCALR